MTGLAGALGLLGSDTGVSSSLSGLLGSAGAKALDLPSECSPSGLKFKLGGDSSGGPCGQGANAIKSALLGAGLAAAGPSISDIGSAISGVTQDGFSSVMSGIGTAAATTATTLGASPSLASTVSKAAGSSAITGLVTGESGSATAAGITTTSSSFNIGSLFS